MWKDRSDTETVTEKDSREKGVEVEGGDESEESGTRSCVETHIREGIKELSIWKTSHDVT